jgi:RNA polymerase sigma-70 factor (ECF subfamily)
MEMTTAWIGRSNESTDRVSSQPEPTETSGWVERAKLGDREAFEILYRTFVGRIHALCRRFASDPTRAEDLTQEAFIRLWQRIGSFRGESSFYSWFYRMTTNLCLDHIRAESRRTGVDFGGELPETAGDDPRPTAQSAIDLEQAIAELPPHPRMVFVLHDVEGYRHQDIAAMSGLAPGTCRAHLHRARRLLRARLGS